MPVSDQAFVTLATNDIYCQGALVLGQSLRNHRATRRLVVLVTPQVSSLLSCRALAYLKSTGQQFHRVPFNSGFSSMFSCLDYVPASLKNSPQKSAKSCLFPSFMAVSCGRSWARDGSCATAAMQATAVTTPDP